ncbi:MAG: hypothetical protein HY716_07710 [Planctomycetes bacterium]|nr:hypothetical protein [Planctomycetota bacterium]
MKILSATAACLLMAACASTPSSPGVEKAVFPDLPAAEGLKYDAGYGQSTPSGEIRTYRQEYSGSRRLADVAQFYRDALPKHGWTPAGSEGENPMTLRFEKKAEAVTIGLDGRGPLLKVTVNVGLKK